MLVPPEGVSLPVTLSAVCVASELSCAIPSYTLKAAHWHHVKHRNRVKGSSIQELFMLILLSKSLYASLITLQFTLASMTALLYENYQDAA